MVHAGAIGVKRLLWHEASLLHGVGDAVKIHLDGIRLEEISASDLFMQTGSAH